MWALAVRPLYPGSGTPAPSSCYPVVVGGFKVSRAPRDTFGMDYPSSELSGERICMRLLLQIEYSFFIM